MPTTLSILNRTGGEVESLELPDNVLERERGEQAVHDAVVAFLADRRAGTASTRNRARIRGTGSKPYRQKGTGRARAGTVKSPVWRGGGVVFGPMPRSFAKGINRKVKLLALRRAFTERIDAGELLVVDDIQLDEAKTKAMVAFLEAVGAGDDAVVLVDEPTPEVALAARNLPNVVLMPAASVNAYWMLSCRKVLVTKGGLDVLMRRLAVKEKAE